MSNSQINISRRQLFTRRKDAEKPNLPWVKNHLFTDVCTQCGKCSNACPEQIIKSSDGGFPRVDFNHGECTFCYRCAEVCPEPLFHPKTEPAWQVTADISDLCLAKKNVDCRSCGDSCEPQAIRFKLAVGSVAQPQIETDSCTGCGACVSVCPTNAITIKHVS
ncbi:ferredoxin-type protein NapF [Vibrio rumoiensis]|uniref:Ferredoxin-type protein NapF n=1 Tax=Vibrio rumoiensis TaxID=76258 RepID=A0ABW7IZL9_9VIBR|nr:ferredoxin-type protein NapF [Vibrio rumoiensis]